MVNSVLPSTEVPLEARSHHAPSRPRPEANCGIRVLDAQHALLNEVEDFLVERRLQPVRDMARKRLEQANRLFPDRRIKCDGLFNRLERRPRSADHFHQRNYMWRVEWMSDHAPLGI